MVLFQEDKTPHVRFS